MIEITIKALPCPAEHWIAQGARVCKQSKFCGEQKNHVHCHYDQKYRGRCNEVVVPDFDAIETLD